MTPDHSTKERLLAAAVELIAEDGVQAVTHRSVEARAGVARGSTRYHFATRDTLLEAVIEYVAGQFAELFAAVGVSLDLDGTPATLTEEEIRSALAMETELFLADPSNSLVTYELYLYAARRPELAPTMTRWRLAFVSFGAAYLAARGAPEPEASSRMMVATLDGMVLHDLSSPHPDYRRWGPEWMRRAYDLALTFGATPPEGEAPSGDVSS